MHKLVYLTSDADEILAKSPCSCVCPACAARCSALQPSSAACHHMTCMWWEALWTATGIKGYPRGGSAQLSPTHLSLFPIRTRTRTYVWCLLSAGRALHACSRADALGIRSARLPIDEEGVLAGKRVCSTPTPNTQHPTPNRQQHASWLEAPSSPGCHQRLCLCVVPVLVWYRWSNKCLNALEVGCAFILDLLR